MSTPFTGGDELVAHLCLSAFDAIHGPVVPDAFVGPCAVCHPVLRHGHLPVVGRTGQRREWMTGSKLGVRSF